MSMQRCGHGRPFNIEALVVVWLLENIYDIT
jgi:hypothetical protein